MFQYNFVPILLCPNIAMFQYLYVPICLCSNINMSLYFYALIFLCTPFPMSPYSSGPIFLIFQFPIIHISWYSYMSRYVPICLWSDISKSSHAYSMSPNFSGSVFLFFLWLVIQISWYSYAMIFLYMSHIPIFPYFYILIFLCDLIPTVFVHILNRHCFLFHC